MKEGVFGRSNERGAVLVEGALSVIILLVLVIGTFEVSRLVQNYYLLNQVASEALRYGTKIPRLAEGTFISGDSSLDDPTHVLIQNRVNRILQVQGQLLHLTGDVRIETTHETAGSTDPRNNGAVSVLLHANHDGIFGSYDGFQITVSHTGEYLY